MTSLGHGAQGLETHHLSEKSFHDTASMLEEAGSQLSLVGSRDNTSLSQMNEGRASEK